MSKQTLILIILLSLGLAACSSDGLTDLREFTKSTHKNKKPRVDPIPEVRVHEKFAYRSYKLPDPFAAENLRRVAIGLRGSGQADKGPKPDLTRPKEPLEEYPLDALAMVGTLSKGKNIWAIIRVASANGEIHRVKVGNHIGRNYGMVTEITEEKIVLVELVRSALGDWIEREASVQLRE